MAEMTSEVVKSPEGQPATQVSDARQPSIGSNRNLMRQMGKYIFFSHVRGGEYDTSGSDAQDFVSA